MGFVKHLLNLENGELALLVYKKAMKKKMLSKLHNDSYPKN
jgi:hypothetical protein